MAYTPPVYSHQNFGSTGAGAIIDIGDLSQGVAPPVLILVISATATVKIEGSHDGVAFADFTGGGLTSSDARDVVVGIRFWRTNISANTGTVTSSIGPVPTITGGYVSPHLMSVSSGPVL